MKLPARRKPLRSGIRREPKRKWPRHEKWVRGHTCSVPDCTGTPIEFAHVRSAANAGTGLKPHSAFGVSLCFAHHREQHNDGVETFQRRHKIDLFALAAAFVRASPDVEMRASLRLVTPGEIEAAQ